jgi:cell division septal protein FtsQ
MVPDYNQHLKTLRRKQFKKTSRKFYLISGGVFLILAGLVYVLFFAKLFDIRAVKVNATQNISADEIQKLAETWLNGKYFGIERRKNYLFFQPQKISAILTGNIFAASSVLVTRTNHDLEINVSERKPIGVWCLTKQNQCFFFDDDGIAFRETNPSEGFIYLNVVDDRDRTVNLGQQVESKEWLDRIISVKDLLNRNQFEAAQFVLPEKTFDEFDVETIPQTIPQTNNIASGQNLVIPKSFNIMLSTTTDYEHQLSDFIDVYNKKMTPDERSNLQYADLRVADRIYYK